MPSDKRRMVLHDGEMEHDECKACKTFHCVPKEQSESDRNSTG